MTRRIESFASTLMYLANVEDISDIYVILTINNINNISYYKVHRY